MIRKIGILTTCSYKFEEIKKAFDLYDIKCIKLDQRHSRNKIKKLFQQNTPGEKFICFLFEQTKLISRLTDNYIPSPLTETSHLEPVKHESFVGVYRIVDDVVEFTSYRHTIDGYIDFSKRTSNNTSNNTSKIYNWDDVFVVKVSGMTYHEHSQQNMKITPRDINISNLIKDIVYYKQLTNLTYHPHNQVQPIEFLDVWNFTQSIKELNESENKILVNTNLINIIKQSCNEGLFVRAAINRRQKIYWYPGLNAGIPYTNKPKDRMHEITYMFHDFSHFNVPDLIYTGNNNPINRIVYIIYRLMSEIISLVMSDMLYVDIVLLNGGEYKTKNERNIYPLYTEAKKIYDIVC